MSLDFFPPCSQWDLLSLLVFTLSLLSLLLLWLLLFYTHNKRNYPNNYQTINYSFKCYFLFFFTITVVVIIIINNNTNIIIITFIIISIIIIVYFVFSPFCKCILYPLIFLFFIFMPQVQDEQSHPLHLILPISFLWLPFLD